MMNTRIGFVFSLMIGFCLAIALSPQTIAAEVNLIRDGSFEETTLDENQNVIPANFRFSRYSGDAPAALDTTIARTGNHSMRIEGDGETRVSIYAYPGNYIAVEGGQTYKVSIWYRHAAEDQGAQVGATQLRIMAFDSQRAKVNWDMNWIPDPLAGDYQVMSGENLHILAWRDAPDDWAELTAEFTLPSDVAYLYPEAFNWYGDGTVWFDDFALFLILAD